jgi:hypothetical protein
MTKKELLKLTKAIREIYPSFKGYDDLSNFKYEEVYKNFQLHSGAEEPTYEELIEGLRYEDEKDVWMQCDLCKKKIYYTTWEEFDKHHRKCEKIDFIDRQAKELKGEGINKEHFRMLPDNELDDKYRKWMDNYLSNNKEFIPKTL